MKTLFLFFLCFTEPELDFADSLFTYGLYEPAIGQYQRFIFYQFSSPSLPYAQYKLGLSYLKRGKAGDRLKGERILRDIVFHLNSQEDSLVRKMAKSSLIRYYLDNGGIEAAEDFLITTSDTTFLRRIRDVKLPKKEWLASFFSIFLPGLGEIYAGRYKEGITTFLVNALCGYGIYYCLKEDKKLDASLIFSFLFLRFYQGSVRNAARFTRKYNENYLKKKLSDWKILD